MRSSGEFRNWALLCAICITALALSQNDGKERRSLKATTPKATTVPMLEPHRGRLANKPTEIPARGWKDIFWRIYNESSDDRILAVAAGMTFYALLALFPGIAAFVSLYSLLGDPGALAAKIESSLFLLPTGAGDIVLGEIRRAAANSTSLLSLKALFTLALAIYGANAAMKATFDGLNVAYEEREKRTFLALNVQSLCFTVLGLAFLLSANFLMIGVPIILKQVYLGSGTETVIALARWPVASVLMFMVLAALYRYGPSRTEPKWRWVTVGSAAAVILWIAVSAAFSWYVSAFAGYDRTYGSLGTLIALMTWIWLSATTVLLGAEINAEMEHQTVRDTTISPEKPLGLRGARMADTIGKAAS